MIVERSINLFNTCPSTILLLKYTLVVRADGHRDSVGAVLSKY